MINIVALSHQLIEPLAPLTCALDLTCGNGYDTVFLANRSQRVYAFDIQNEAILATSKKLNEASLKNVTLIEDSHDRVDKYVNETVDVAIFNLGYQPGGNTEIKTTPSTTIASINAIIPLLKPNGKIILVLYPKNHDHEAETIRTMCQMLSGKIVDCMEYRLLNKVDAPFIIEIIKQ